MHIEFLSENLKGREQLGHLCVDGRIILKSVMKVIGYEDEGWI
jgi:hypothetical protein